MRKRMFHLKAIQKTKSMVSYEKIGKSMVSNTKQHTQSENRWFSYVINIRTKPNQWFHMKKQLNKFRQSMASYAKTYMILENMVSYFSLQKHSLKENGLIKKYGCIWNEPKTNCQKQ